MHPLAAEGRMTLDELPEHAVVEKVAYVANEEIFAYRLDGLDDWYNEAWLQFDEYLPKILLLGEGEDDVMQKPWIKDKVDALLDEINDYKRLKAKFGGEEYEVRIEELKQELAKLSGK